MAKSGHYGYLVDSETGKLNLIKSNNLLGIVPIKDQVNLDRTIYIIDGKQIDQETLIKKEGKMETYILDFYNFCLKNSKNTFVISNTSKEFNKKFEKGIENLIEINLTKSKPNYYFLLNNK